MRSPVVTDQLAELHNQYSALLDARRRREIAELHTLVGDLLNIVETGMMNHIAMAKARKIQMEA